MGRILRRWEDRKWDHTLAEAARVEAGFETMEAYIWRRHKTTGRMQETRVEMWWWEQAGINIAGVRETVTAAAEADEDGMEE